MRIAFIGCLVASVFLMGCQEKAKVAETQPSKEIEAPAPPATPRIEAPSPTSKEPPAPPKRPKDTWMLFREALDEKTDTSISTEWTGGKRLEVKTKNVRKVVLDLTKLPDDAPKRGPWTLQIDEQGIEIFGRKGLVMDLLRSPNGDWSIVPDSHRSKP